MIISWNRGADRVFGYTADEAVGQHITLIIPADRREEETEILARLKRAERIDHFETIRQRKDGSLLDISLSVSPVRDSSGAVIGALKVARDITERKNAEGHERTALVIKGPKASRLKTFDLSNRGQQAARRENSRPGSSLVKHENPGYASGQAQTLERGVSASATHVRDDNQFEDGDACELNL